MSLREYIVTSLTMSLASTAFFVILGLAARWWYKRTHPPQVLANDTCNHCPRCFATTLPCTGSAKHRVYPQLCHRCVAAIHGN
jgi:hypothetical protein